MRKGLLHCNVTAHPRAAWAAQQIVEAVGPSAEIVRLIRDRNAIYGAEFKSRVSHLDIEQMRIAPRSPWQNGFAERWIGTLRRELLDHVIVLGERHLRLVRQHVAYYNCDRPTCRSPVKRRSREQSSHRASAKSSLCPELVAFTTDTRGLRDLRERLFRHDSVSAGCSTSTTDRPRDSSLRLGRVLAHYANALSFSKF